MEEQLYSMIFSGVIDNIEQKRHLCTRNHLGHKCGKRLNVTNRCVCRTNCVDARNSLRTNVKAIVF